MDNLVILACWVAVAVLALLLYEIARGRRAQSLEAEARALGFSFHGTAKPFEGSDVRGLEALVEDPSTVVTNVAEATIGNRRVFLFDLPSCDPSTEVAVVTTVAAFRSSGHLPIFQIGTKGILDKVGEKVLRKAAYFDVVDREFGKQFFVHSADAGTRAFFTPARLRDLRMHIDHFRIESSPDWVLVYRPGVKVDATGLGKFVTATSTVAAALLQGDDTSRWSPQPAIA